MLSHYTVNSTILYVLLFRNQGQGFLYTLVKLEQFSLGPALKPGKSFLDIDLVIQCIYHPSQFDHCFTQITLKM